MSTYLLLHGALGSSSQLLPLKTQLENIGHIVYTLKFSGHGGQPFSENGFGIEIFAEELLQFLNSQKIERINIFGYSMGGYVALWLAHQHPERFQKIITLGTKFDWSPESAAKEVKMLDPEKLQEKVPAFAETLKQRHLPNDWKILLQKTAEMMLTLVNKPPLTDEVLKQIKIPTMICQGEMDAMADINYTKQVAGYLPQAECKMLAKTPHPIEKVKLNLITELLA